MPRFRYDRLDTDLLVARTPGVGLVDWLCRACGSSTRQIFRLLTSLERAAVAFEMGDLA